MFFVFVTLVKLLDMLAMEASTRQPTPWKRTLRLTTASFRPGDRFAKEGDVNFRWFATSISELDVECQIESN